MALPSSGQISLEAIANNNSSASLSNLSLQTESQRFASASVVGDVDGNGTGGQASDRAALTAAPHALSEFYDANFPSSIITGITFATAGSDTNTVDDENLGVTFTTNGTSGTYTVRLIDSSGNSDLSGTRSGAGTVTFTNLQLTEDTYRPQVEFDAFNVVNDDATFTHHDQLDGESTSLSYTSANVDAADESVSNVVVTPAVSTGTQESSSIATSVVTAGDGGDISATVSSISSQVHTMAIANVPGVLRFTSTHIGDPSAARNSETSTADLTISYNRAIDGVGTLDTSNAGKTQFNSGDTIRVFAVSEGVQSVTMKMGYGTANNDTTYTADDDKSISDSRFVRSSQTFDTSRTLTSGTSLETFFPKANYTSGTSALSAGSSFSVAPAFSYSTTGNQTINIDQTQNFAASSIVGNNVVIAVTSSPNIGSGNTNSGGNVTMSPGSGNDVYTITFDGSANFSQTNDQTDTLTVNPTAALSVSPSSGNPTTDTHGGSITSTSHGISATTFTYSGSIKGSNINSIKYAMDGDFSLTSGNIANAASIQGTYVSPGGSNATKNAVFQVGGNTGRGLTNATSSAAGVTVNTISKNFDSATSDQDEDLRRGATMTVSLQVDHIMRAKLVRTLSSGTEDITGTTAVNGGGFNQTEDVDFTINSDATIDSTARAITVVDVDRTAETREVIGVDGGFKMLAATPVVNSFSATAPGTIGRITVSYNVSNAKTNGIVIQRALNVGMSSGLTTVLTTSTAAASVNFDSLTGNTQFFFRVTVTNDSNESVQSSVVNATTPLDTQWSSVPTVSVPFLAGEEYTSDVFQINLTQGTGNTTVAIDSSTIASHLQQNEIAIALSTSDTTPSSFVRLHGGGSAVSRTISHTSGVLYFAFKVSDDEEDINSSSDDAFTMSFTNNSITQNVSGVFRNHTASSTDSAVTTIFANSDVTNSTVKLADNMQISITGTTVGDTITFTAVRNTPTNTGSSGGEFTDLTGFKFAARDGANTAAYDSSGTLASGASEVTVSANSSQTIQFTSDASGLKRYRLRCKANGDGTLENGDGSLGGGGVEQIGTMTLKVTVANSSGNTITNQTLYTWTIEHNPFD